MNILYLAHRIPFPPNKGDKIRSFHQIQHLAKTHNVYLACLVDDRDDYQYVDELQQLCQVVHTAYRSSLTQLFPTGMAFLRGQALSIGAFYSQELQGKVNEILQAVHIDRIIAFSSPMAEYVRHIHDIPKLMDFVDLDSEKWRAYADYQPFPFSTLYRIEAKRLGCYEETIAKEFNQSVFISSEEIQHFRSRVPDCTIDVVPNGVDLDFFHRNGNASSECSHSSSVVFTAAMDYFPNIDGAEFFCQDVLPRIAEMVPDVSFTIVGRKPDKKVLELSRPGVVTVTGTVPDVRPYLVNATVAVAPLRIARGVQNKVLEAMAMGLPVVGTSNAFQGIVAGHENGCRIVDDPQGFADEVVKILKDPEMQRECGRKAREFVQQHCRWDDCGFALEKLIEGMK